MSEDTAHGHHFEPPTNGEATGPQAQQAGAAIPLPSPTLEQVVAAQGKRVEELGIRVHSLLLSAVDAYEQFITESYGFFNLVAQAGKEQPSDHRPTDSAATQASA